MTIETNSAPTGEGTPAAGEGTPNTEGQAPAGEGVAPTGTEPQGTKPEGENKDDKGAAVPEKYEFAMPEGVGLDQAAADEFSTIAKDLKLSQADAQKVAQVGAQMALRQQEQHAARVQSWVESVKTDKEIGGDKLNENMAVARSAIESFGSPELKDVLNATGLGNHPAVVKAFYKIGKAIASDTIVRGGNTTGEVDAAKKLFPNMN